MLKISTPSSLVPSKEIQSCPPTIKAKCSLALSVVNKRTMMMSNSSYIIFLPYFKMDTTIAQPKKYVKQDMKTTVQIPAVKGGVETSYPFQWMLFKPQAHAITPFPTNEQSRLENVSRKK
jgi:hypothetical protein